MNDIPCNILGKMVEKGFLSRANNPSQIDLEFRSYCYSEPILDSVLEEVFQMEHLFEENEVDLKRNFIVLALKNLCEVRQSNTVATTKKEIDRAMHDTFIVLKRRNEILQNQKARKVDIVIDLAEGHVEPKKLAQPRRKTTKLKDIKRFISENHSLPRKELIRSVSETYGVAIGSAAVYVSRFTEK